MLLSQLLEARAVDRPGHAALVHGGRRFTYAELDASASRLAHALRAAGVAPGDRVLVFLDNCPEAVVALFAAWKAAAVSVAVHRSTKEAKLTRIVDDCAPAAIVTDVRALASLREVIGRRGISPEAVILADSSPDEGHTGTLGGIPWERVQSAYPASTPTSTMTATDLAALVYTSGTTGEAKGVMADHAAMCFATESIVDYLGNDGRDVVLSVLPLSFSYGLYQVLAMFHCGGTVVLENSFAFPARLLKLVAEHRITGLPGVPTMFATLLQSNLAAYDLTSLRYMTNAAAPMSPAHIRELRARLPGVAFFSMYGMTEFVRALYLPPAWIDEKPQSVGIAMPGIDVWIEDGTGARVGPGQVGELVVRGRNVMRGYWRRPEETALRFRAGRHAEERVCHTGDLFRADAQGCLYFVSRKDDIIKCRGEKVAPREIENCLHELSGVVEVAVVGIPDPVQGEVVKALVVRSDPSLDASAVKAHCKRHLDDVMVPAIVEFRTSLPRSPSGKLRKEELT